MKELLIERKEGLNLQGSVRIGRGGGSSAVAIHSYNWIESKNKNIRIKINK